MKKSKIIDLVLFYNEKDILERRLSYMEEIVDLTIIVNYGNKTIKKIKENVYEIKLDGPFDLIGTKIYDGIISIFGDKYFKYNDYFIFSKVFELPDADTIIDELYKVDSEQNFLFHKKLMWTESYKSKVNHPGTVLLKYKDLQLLPEIFDYLNRCKNDLQNIGIKSECGWNIQTFQNDIDVLNSINFWSNSNLKLDEITYIKNSLYDLDNPNTRVEKDYTLDLPKKFKSISNYIEYRKQMNVLITNLLDDVQDSKYDIKILVTNSDIETDEFIIHRPNYPSRVLYGNKSYEDFKDDFKFDSLLLTLKKLDLIDEDIIHIKIKSESYDSDFTKIYGEFRKSIPSELIRIFSSSRTFLKSFFALFERRRSH